MPSDLPQLIMLCLIPFLTAGIGWLTNWVAIQMLFHPRRTIGAGPFRLQGLIPKRQPEIAERVADIVEQELLGKEFLKNEIERMDLSGHAERMVVRLIRERVTPRLKALPLVGSRLEPKLIGNLERIGIDIVNEEFHKLRDQMLEDSEKRSRIRDIVRERIASFDLDTLETLVKRIASQEFGQIERLGAVLGFVIGCLQVIILMVVD